MTKSPSQDDGPSWLDLWEYVLDEPRNEESADDDSQDDYFSSILDCLSHGDEKPKKKRRAFGILFWRRAQSRKNLQTMKTWSNNLRCLFLTKTKREEKSGPTARKLEKRPRKIRMMLSRLIGKAHQAEDDQGSMEPNVN
jgi:hypothetical protein